MYARRDTAAKSGMKETLILAIMGVMGGLRAHSMKGNNRSRRIEDSVMYAVAASYFIISMSFRSILFCGKKPVVVKLELPTMPTN